jgi:fatty-acyl-CoA synthase
MWRQDDLFNVLGGAGNPVLGIPPSTDLDDFAAQITGPGPAFLPACPLMHGTAQFTSLLTMNRGGCVNTLVGRRFDAEELWQTVQDHGVEGLAIVGDAFARPMLAALDAAPGRWDLSRLRVIMSSGVMWSQEVKTGLLGHLPGVVLFDSLGSSEAVGLGASLSAAGSAAGTAEFVLGPEARVVTDDGRFVEPGSDEVGMLAVPGAIPMGYYKDPEKTEKTFRVVDGARYSVPGDYAAVEANGTIRLLGRGSGVINTAGEKVFAEEVEEVLKRHPAVGDAVVVGVPDERFGQSVCAVVEPVPGETVDGEALAAFVHGQLAGFKVPRHVVVVSSISRSPAGKVDYRHLGELAKERVQARD